MLEQRMSGDPGYGGVAKVMHWLIVVLVAAQFAIAWTMPDIGRGTRPEGLISLHLTLGITIIVVALLRLAWRWTHPVPLISGNVPPWQHRAAQATHALLYVVLVLLPLMGWANASYRGWRVTSLWGGNATAPTAAGIAARRRTRRHSCSHVLCAPGSGRAPRRRGALSPFPAARPCSSAHAAGGRMTPRGFFRKNLP